MPINYRSFNIDTDVPGVVDIANQPKVAAEPAATVAEFREQIAQFPAELPVKRWSAVDAHDTLVGSSQAFQAPWRANGDFQCTVMIDAAHQRQGIGSELYNRALAFARENRAQRLFVGVRDSLPGSLAFAEQRGFTMDRHIFNSMLDVPAFDESPFAGVIESVETGGIRFTTLAEVGDTRENRLKLYELDKRTALDIPGDNHPAFTTFERFEAALYPADHALTDATILALDGDEWVAFTALDYGNPEMLWHFMTGTDRRYRGRQLGLAVKLLAIRYAKAHSIKQLGTSNDSANAPMLAINTKLGYKRLTGFYSLFKNLV